MHQCGYVGEKAVCIHSQSVICGICLLKKAHLNTDSDF